MGLKAPAPPVALKKAPAPPVASLTPRTPEKNDTEKENNIFAYSPLFFQLSEEDILTYPVPLSQRHG